MSWVLDSKVLEQLKCFTCKKYISFGPVTQITDGYNCGRCSGNGMEINKFFEIFAKNCLFPCIYGKDGCGVKLSYGETVINHEKVCKYRSVSCPVTDDSIACEWNGSAINSFEHCSNEHKMRIVESNEFKFILDLNESLDKKTLIRTKTGEILMVHVFYTKEMGCSVNVTSFVVKSYKTVLSYSLALRSSQALKKGLFYKTEEVVPFSCDGRNSNRIPFEALFLLDMAKISALVVVKRDENITDTCDSCDQPLSLYIMKCSKNHRFCKKCCHAKEPCVICQGSLQICSNYSAMKAAGGNFECCNAMYGCIFLSNLPALQKHEEKCEVIKCVVRTCNWNGTGHIFFDHLLAHQTTANEIKIRAENFEDNTYFVWLDASCTRFQGHTHKCGLFIVQVVVDDAGKTVKVVANYVTSSVGTKFAKGYIQIKFGKGAYRGPIEKMKGCDIDQSGEIHLYRCLIKQNEDVTIKLVNCELFCTVN